MADESVISGLLGAGSQFDGNIEFEGTLRIDGSVNGNITCSSDRPSKVIITELSRIEADIIADEVIVSGEVVGRIKAIQRLEVLAPGRVEGLVYTSDFSIEDGALFEGQCVMIRHFNEEDKKTFKLESFYDLEDI